MRNSGLDLVHTSSHTSNSIIVCPPIFSNESLEVRIEWLIVDARKSLSRFGGLRRRRVRRPSTTDVGSHSVGAGERCGIESVVHDRYSSRGDE